MQIINDCNSRVIFKIGVLIGTPVLISNKDIGYYLKIFRKDNIDIWWNIDIINFKYISYSERKMNNEEKEDFYNIMKNNLEEILKEFKAICIEDCENKECIFYNKDISSISINYNNL